MGKICKQTFTQRKYINCPKKHVKRCSISLAIGGGHLVAVMSDSCDPTDCSLPGSSVHGILQARTLEWDAICSANQNLSEGTSPVVQCLRPCASNTGASGSAPSWGIVLRCSQKNKHTFNEIPLHTNSDDQEFKKGSTLKNSMAAVPQKVNTEFLFIYLYLFVPMT